MKNREKMKRVYNEIHAPEALVRKVMDMSKTNETKKFKTRNVVKYAVCTLAVAAMTFVASNGICYAATGETLVTKVKVIINNQQKELDMKWSKDGNKYEGEVVIPGDDTEEKRLIIETEERDGTVPDVLINSDDTVSEDGNVVEESVTVEFDDDTVQSSVTIESELEK